MKNKAKKVKILFAGIVTLADIFLMLAVTVCSSPVIPETRDTRYTITVKDSANGTVSADKETAQTGEIVTLTIVPDRGYESTSIRVSGFRDIAINGSGSTRTFTMPAEDVFVSAAFQSSGGSKYRITINEMTGGTFNSSPADYQHENGLVQLTAQPDPGQKYRPGSLKVTGSDSGKTVKTDPAENSDVKWTFEMPGEDMEVDALFIDESTILYGISVIQTAYGSIYCGQTSAVPGDAVIIMLVIDDNANYRYAKDSLVITGTDSGRKMDFEPDSELQWVFVMPDEAVTVEASVEFIPYHSIIITENVQNGSLFITGVEAEGGYAGQAREGAAITITAAPDSGYKPADNGLFVLPQGAVVVTKLEGQAAWTFNMADKNLEIGITFAELGPLEIYKGGARKGVMAGEPSDDKKYYANSVIMESDEGGHNGNRRTIKVIPALNSNGNAVQQSFGLFSDTEIDLDTVAALSFWAKANKNLNIRYVGFGDAHQNRRVIYAGENNNHSIPINTVWKRYIVPVPASNNGQKTARVFFFNALVTVGNYVCIDDIEFIQNGVTLTGIQIPDANDGIFYGATDAAKIFKSAPIKLNYACTDGTKMTLQSGNNYSLYYNLVHWLTPFIQVKGNVTFTDGIIIPKEKNSAFTLTVNMAGTTSNPMTARLFNGLLLDDFEDVWAAGNVSIPGTPAPATGHLWYTTSSGSTVVTRDYFNVASKEIHSGLCAGSWRSTAAANKPRGGRNFNPKDASGYDTLVFWVKVTTGGANLIIQKNTVFTFELKNGGELTNKTAGSFFPRQFTYNADDWQEFRMPLADFINEGLDISAITGYAVGVVNNQGVDIRIMLDDIALVKD